MISENFFTPEPPSSVLAHTWALSVFRVDDYMAEQRVLRALRLLGRIDWDSLSDEVHLRQVVMAADAHPEIMASARQEALP